MTLGGTVALVTGASKGMGAGIAQRLAAEGAIVVTVARDRVRLEKVVRSIEEAGGAAIAIPADLATKAGIDELFASIKDKFGRLNVLVNNAGIDVLGTLSDITPDVIDLHHALNVKALLLATQAAAPLFPAKGGVIINISSGSALTPLPSAHVYSSTKGAVDVLTRSLAMELGPRGIRVVGVAPGFTQTEGMDDLGMDDVQRNAIIARTPLRRIGQPSDIAAVVAFLASADAGWITGETIQVGGGLRL